MKKVSGSIRTCSESLLAVWLGEGFFFFPIFYFSAGEGWGSVRGFTVPTDSGVGRHEKESYSRTYTLGVIVAFPRLVG